MPESPDKNESSYYALEYAEDSITATHSDNGLKRYEDYLDLSRANLQGKTILDLGVGRTDRFARELKEAGIDANVIGLSPDFKDSYTRHALEHETQKTSPGWRRKAVAGIAQQLPFKDETFDLVVSLYALTYYSWFPEQVQAWVSEIGRVLRGGGEARLAPNCKKRRSGAFGENYEILKDSAKKAGLEVQVSEKNILLQKLIPQEKK